MTQTIYSNRTNEELIRQVDNTGGDTPLELELANRLDELQVEIKMLNATMTELESKLEAFEDDGK